MAVVEMWFSRWLWVRFPSHSPYLLQGWSQVAFPETGLQSPAEEPDLAKQPKDSVGNTQPTPQAPSEKCVCVTQRLQWLSMAAPLNTQERASPSMRS